ncbi:hypothetical protein [Tuwongella immobilis]|uniref:Uncharacterized protein n=1 Tax=Tuwongella immobilis TaxID=692036 RepID=A0A6C2YKT6_9BACT|nr:hypothetical protein [Tuwongella immobilis]VIP02188.1 unnamed protein product [Tuwongella immobilis]VTS00651.1 unnamed protein product [Tuwongella immobilis]
MAEKYVVDYQVFGVIYFEHDNIFSGPDLAHLWKQTHIFGDQKGLGNFYRLDAITNPNRPRSFRLGTMNAFDPLLLESSLPIYGGVSSTQRGGRFCDCDFFFSQGTSGRSFGYETLPEFVLGCSGQWFELAGSEAVVELFRTQLEIADQYSPPYALVDVAASEDCYSGFAYVSCFSLNNRLHRWSEHIKWLYACSKQRDQARGVYWGNYFGAAILDRLGGRERFLTRFREQTQDAFGSPNARIWEFPNGVFVSLCMDPLGCKPGQPLDGSAGQNLHWLVLELGSHGVLNPWADNQPRQP